MARQAYELRWEAYLRAYAPIGPDERAELLNGSVADDVVFTNPGGEGRTRVDLIRHIEDFQGKMPGAYFATQQLMHHHGELLAIWAMHRERGAKVATGYNFVQFDPDGRFSYMAGFFEPRTSESKPQ